MSARNGDEPRFHRQRKQKIARRQQISELLRRERTERRAVEASSHATARSVPA